MKHSARYRPKLPGFALVFTLSLMILLTIITVGLLSLSAVSLRAAGSPEHLSVARANARMAMMLAVGELQKHLGPDQRISAKAEILDEAPETWIADDSQKCRLDLNQDGLKLSAVANNIVSARIIDCHTGRPGIDKMTGELEKIVPQNPHVAPMSWRQLREFSVSIEAAGTIHMPIHNI